MSCGPHSGGRRKLRRPYESLLKSRKPLGWSAKDQVRRTRSPWRWGVSFLLPLGGGGGGGLDAPVAGLVAVGDGGLEDALSVAVDGQGELGRRVLLRG